MELYFDKEKAKVFRMLDDKGDLVKIEIKYKDENETLEQYYLEDGVPIYARIIQYTTPAGAKSTDSSLRCGIPKEQLPNKLIQIMAKLKA